MPGTATFRDATTAGTTAAFLLAGNCTLQVTAEITSELRLTPDTGGGGDVDCSDLAGYIRDNNGASLAELALNFCKGGEQM